VTVWILTDEYNMYDQYGEYFIAVFKEKPTHQQLTAHGVETNRLHHTLNGGGRGFYDDEHWFHLKEVTPE
jgi:hypothetical protein